LSACWSQAPLMKVILLEDVAGLGSRGAVVQVADGYGRNYLLPRKLAIPATESNLRSLEQAQQAHQTRVDRELIEAENIARILRDGRVVLRARSGQGGRLFGSITTKDIAAGIEAQRRVSIDRKRIDLQDPIR